MCPVRELIVAEVEGMRSCPCVVLSDEFLGLGEEIHSETEFACRLVALAILSDVAQVVSLVLGKVMRIWASLAERS